MVSISKGRNIACLDGKGGNEKLYLAKWNPNIDYSLVGDTISNLSGLDFYEFGSLDVLTDISLQHNDEGEFYQIDISFSLLKVDKETSALINTLIDMFLVAAVIDKYGVARVYGLRNGLTGEYPETSGGAKQSFSGYQIKLSGEQTEKPFYINKDYFETVYNLTGLFVNNRLVFADDKAITLT